ncbi:hypothetical protein MB46_19315 (plasmid) [Arthrobacter alpinus]|uniref:hypothetical protein n=1 Tax=Arthrobacter alpinus TaxID=656366 RepID=UPI0005CA2816|nr:hypothetical protein [Arthrobacter alpinus]ALV47829.1 hypothetical protein MB46_19315 [Arthrobacter alpinus]
MSDHEQHPEVEIEGESPDWDEIWEDSPIPEDKERWREIISQISPSPELAERLVGHGWDVIDLEAAAGDPLSLIGLAEIAIGPKEEAAFVVLADAVSRIYESRQRLALELRQQAMIDLSLPVLDAQEQVLKKGWTFDTIGALVGLTKQRARAIAKPAHTTFDVDGIRAKRRSLAIKSRERP